MKYASIIVAVILSCTLTAQENNWTIGNEIGRVIDLEKSAKGYQYTFDLQRHLALEIHGVVSYNRTQLFDGFHPQIKQDQVPRSITHFNTFALGIKKTLKISRKGVVGISIKGNWIQKKSTVWYAGLNQNGLYNLERLRGNYLKRDDLGFGVNLEYNHRIGQQLTIGCYGSYLINEKNSESLELLSFGVRTAITINTVADKTESTERKEEHKNWMEWSLGAYGGDGTPSMANFDLILGRQLFRNISFYGKFSIGQRTIDNDSVISALDQDQQEIYAEERLWTGNEAGLIYFTPSQSTSYGAGLKIQINGDGRSKLYLSGGASYFIGQFVRTSSTGPYESSLEESFIQYKTILPELGLQYDFDISDSFYIGGKGTIAFNRINIGLGLHAGFRF